MRCVPQTTLWIGAARHARDSSGLASNGIRAVVDLAVNEAPASPARELVYCRIPLYDGAGNDPELLDLALSTIARMLNLQIPVLVACSMGMSRAPAIAAGALALAHGAEPAHALLRVTTGGGADVSPALWAAVVQSVERIRAKV
ncbi:MAG: dual specificity protein phosphatase [Phycisphaerales bacterium]